MSSQDPTILLPPNAENLDTAKLSDALNAEISNTAQSPETHFLRHVILRMIKTILVTDSELDAFTIDYFPAAFMSYSAGMNREGKIKILLSQETSNDILRALRQIARNKWEARLQNSSITRSSEITISDIDILSNEFPSRRILRKMIDSLFVTDSELNAFIINYFPNSAQNYSLAMNRIEKTNLLLEKEELNDIMNAINQIIPETHRRSIISPRRASEIFTIIISDNINDMKLDKLSEILDNLKSITGDQGLIIKKVVAGSVVLILEGGKETHTILEELFRTRQLTKFVGVEILAVLYRESGLVLESANAQGKIINVMEFLKQQPTSASLRKLLNKLITDDPNFDAFCLDYFPLVKMKFTIGMDRTTKTNFLLESSNLKEIFTALYQEYPHGVIENRNLLQFEEITQMPFIYNERIATNG